MKIIRMKSGYRIKLSDGEFEAIKSIVDLGCQWMNGDPDIVETICVTSSTAHNRAMNALVEDPEFADVDEILEVTENRR